MQEWLEARSQWAQACLRRHLPFAREEARSQPGEESLSEVMHYALMGGGKRFRPALVHLLCTELGGDEEHCELPACAVECIHTYSLVHDDLPCMDDDDLRRGRPSCHARFGEARAVLCGDALQAGAFELLAQGPARHATEWTRILAVAAGAQGMVGGQALDMQLSAAAAGPEDVRAMHRKKTGALIAAAAEMGAVAADADPAARRLALDFGRALGALFQVTDDILDVTSDTRSLGKTAGKDERQGKATLVRALGLEGARAEARSLAGQARERASALGLGPGSAGLALVDGLLGRRK
jgi:farnesyl diphosphate synthase